ncbi:MAG: hypothetical protein GY898_04925 [Proteobacteria bacterium]|nr:hypothetical protein [Pseudomonadota bacterium]
MTRFALPVLLLLFAVGCGPIRSTVGIIQADQVIKQAREAGAETWAPYPFQLAESLYAKAIEEQGYAQYYQSWLYAKEAKTMAEEALATEAGAPEPVPEPAPEAPADPEPEPSE